MKTIVIKFNDGEIIAIVRVRKGQTPEKTYQRTMRKQALATHELCAPKNEKFEEQNDWTDPDYSFEVFTLE